ncbi:methionine--tRNA ligase [bacterium endosymbiont of Pedicinus badii]|uniref:methionine--tRNA ligase n=1 Tax=bacterium endosymbiont of Pedicinus badii TaxID=1719126 RepID=UPI0009BB29DD|nr:methionine--tRNA ligase [bacterium endosymbiont of Pedicinus badii]OQM34437.1 hypothetical protein AOQ89_00930 [bacterium endosymbiont of Pedicinus badii]
MKRKNNKKILVTCALPYINGPIHLGHILEHVQADIWVRFQKMIGKKIYFICAEDTHGTATLINSKKLNISPENLIKKVHIEHKKDLLNFDIKYDHFCSSNSLENKKFVVSVYKKLLKSDLIYSKMVLQLYDKKEKIFLSDRFITGTCPKCFTNNQNGDNCEFCGEHYEAVDLINPISKISNTVPIKKKSKHYFLDLSKIKKNLINSIKSIELEESIFLKLIEWFPKKLKSWNISRNSPYFGFRIPNSKKYFYVWFDALITYISAFKIFCKSKKNLKFEKFWKRKYKYDTMLFHFIGKDIIYFHGIFWIAILNSINFRIPNAIFVHGHLKINGKKMSKSKNNFITVKKYLQFLDSDYIRYYFASKLSNKFDDINLEILDFRNKVNSDLVNKIANLASRCEKIIQKEFSGFLSKKIDSKQLGEFLYQKNMIENFFISRRNDLAVRAIIKLARKANHYIDKMTPWKIKNKEKMHNVCSTGINMYKIIVTYLSPIVPKLAKKSSEFLNFSINWNNIDFILISHKIKKFKKILKRISLEEIKNIII